MLREDGRAAGKISSKDGVFEKIGKNIPDRRDSGEYLSIPREGRRSRPVLIRPAKRHTIPWLGGRP